jgi:hypothetical protein
MATAAEPIASAEERAWELFFEALDPDSPAAVRLPSGAAFVAADAPDRDDVIRRYKAEGRPVVVVDGEGREKIIRPSRLDHKSMLLLLALGTAAWIAFRRSSGPA